MANEHMHGKGKCAWQRGGCMCGEGEGHVWQGMHGRGGMVGRGWGMHGRGMHGGGHVWQGATWPGCMHGRETATAVDGTHPTGIHSCV